MTVRSRASVPLGCVALAALGLMGCRSYTAMPIDVPSVEQALAVPSDDVLRVRARELAHPILGPIELDGDDGLSPDEAAVLAVLLNPRLRVIRDGRHLAEAQVIQAGLLPNPELSASLETPTGGDTRGRVDPFGLGLSFDLSSLLGRQHRREAARAAQDSVDLTVAWREWQTAQAARLGAIRAIALEAQLQVASESENRAAADVERVVEAGESGMLTLEQVGAAHDQLAALRTERLQLEEQVVQARADLNHLLGLPPNRVVRLQSDGIPAADFIVPSESRLLEGLEDRRLDLVALRRAADAQDARLRAALLRQFPRISIGVLHDRDTDDIQSTGIGISISLPIFDRGQAQIRREKARRQQLFDEYAGRVFDARNNIAKLRDVIGVMRSRLTEAERVRGERADRLQHLARASEQGMVVHMEFTGVDIALAEATMDIVALQTELARAAIALELASALPFVRLGPG